MNGLFWCACVFYYYFIHYVYQRSCVAFNLSSSGGMFGDVNHWKAWETIAEKYLKKNYRFNRRMCVESVAHFHIILRSRSSIAIKQVPSTQHKYKQRYRFLLSLQSFLSLFCVCVFVLLLFSVPLNDLCFLCLRLNAEWLIFCHRAKWRKKEFRRNRNGASSGRLTPFQNTQ